MYGFEDDDDEDPDLVLFCFSSFPPNNWRFTKVLKNKSCSDTGNTNGPRVVMLVLSASPPISIRSRLTLIPLNPCSSSSWYTLLLIFRLLNSQWINEYIKSYHIRLIEYITYPGRLKRYIIYFIKNRDEE